MALLLSAGALFFHGGNTSYPITPRLQRLNKDIVEAVNQRKCAVLRGGDLEETEFTQKAIPRMQRWGRAVIAVRRIGNAVSEAKKTCNRK